MDFLTSYKISKTFIKADLDYARKSAITGDSSTLDSFNIVKFALLNHKTFKKLHLNDLEIEEYTQDLL